MKTFKIIGWLALAGATVLQGWMADHYHHLADEVRKAALVNHSQATELTKQAMVYNSLPKPYAEMMQEALRDEGCTNVNCLVWGEHNGHMLGFMVRSNSATFMPHLELRMQEISEDEARPVKKL